MGATKTVRYVVELNIPDHVSTHQGQVVTAVKRYFSLPQHMVTAKELHDGDIVLTFGETDGDCEQSLFECLAPTLGNPEGWGVIANEVEGPVREVSASQGITVAHGFGGTNRPQVTIPWDELRSLHIY